MSNQITYTKHKCFYCNKEISSNGLGKNSHYMKHVREGICVKIINIYSQSGITEYPPTDLWFDCNQNYEELKNI